MGNRGIKLRWRVSSWCLAKSQELILKDTHLIYTLIDARQYKEAKILFKTLCLRLGNTYHPELIKIEEWLWKSHEEKSNECADETDEIAKTVG